MAQEFRLNFCRNWSLLESIWIGAFQMIDREDMLELTRRMTPKRNCFMRIAGAYVDNEGEISGSFNTNFLNLSPADVSKNLSVAKTVPFSKTNEQLREYAFPKSAMGKDSMWKLLNALKACELKNDALMEIFYEQMIDAYPMDYDSAVFLFYGSYDVPIKAADKERLWESEEVYDFMICTVGPSVNGEEAGEPEFGFLYPAFVDRSADIYRIDIFNRNPDSIQEGLMYKLLGREWEKTV